ncbi:MAG: M1 family metallopeptidase [Chitinophagales bacterium]|nr:M1 family metallopeptidase [Chitinophagales bacterium]
MKSSPFIAAIFLVHFVIHTGFAQQKDLPLARDFMQAYESGTRSTDGNPGIHYWQNRGDYVLKIAFDPATALLNGTETITYYNNSPDTLNKLVFHLFPNFYKKGMQRNYYCDEADENEGVTIESLQVDTQMIAVSDNRNLHFRGTNMIVVPDEPILPATKVTLQVVWHYTVNKGSHVRTGMVDPSTFFLAYTFPRIAVYDDINGWDEWSYSGLQEFYNDFGDFDAAITVPKGFVVWATGTLQNAKDVFAPKIYERYRAALSADSIMQIIDSTDYSSGNITATAPLQTWRFTASGVTDFAFALSDHYLWRGSSPITDPGGGRRVFVDAAYNKDAVDFFEVASVARQCVELMSSTYPAVPFPFPHITVFQGLDQMEYPMMVNDDVSESRLDMVQLTSHEIIHSYFPFYMGINETKYAWMDEGWATIGESVISPLLGEPEEDGIYMRKRYESIAGTDREVPVMTNSKLIEGATYQTNSYGKAGLFYYTLQQLLGDELFFKALHAYIDRWHGKHPTPYDFFYTFNNVTGQNLNWFFLPWCFENGYPDLALTGVEQQQGKKTAQNTWQVTVSRKGNIPVPVALQFTLENDSVIEKTWSPVTWKDGSSTCVLRQTLPGKLKSVKLGNDSIPDVYHADNFWQQAH